MAHNLKVKKSSKSPVKLTSKILLLFSIFYTLHNLLIADPDIFDVISMKKEMGKVSKEVEVLKARRESLRKELKNLDEEVLKKEMGSFEEGEFIIIYGN